jgi:hypothetical protein
VKIAGPRVKDTPSTKSTMVLVNDAAQPCEDSMDERTMSGTDDGVDELNESMHVLGL